MPLFIRTKCGRKPDVRRATPRETNQIPGSRQGNDATEGGKAHVFRIPRNQELRLQTFPRKLPRAAHLSRATVDHTKAENPLFPMWSRREVLGSLWEFVRARCCRDHTPFADGAARTIKQAGGPFSKLLKAGQWHFLACRFPPGPRPRRGARPGVDLYGSFGGRGPRSTSETAS